MIYSVHLPAPYRVPALCGAGASCSSRQAVVQCGASRRSPASWSLSWSLSNGRRVVPTQQPFAGATAVTGEMQMQTLRLPSSSERSRGSTVADVTSRCVNGSAAAQPPSTQRHPPQRYTCTLNASPTWHPVSCALSS